MIKAEVPLLCLLLLLLCTTGFAGEQQDREKLKAVSADIRKLERSLKDATGQKNSLAEELRALETESASLQREISQLKSQLNQLEADLKQLGTQRAELQSQSRSQQRLIYSQVNAAYRLGKEEPVKLLLNQEDPALFSRTLKYYSYFLQARANKLNSYISTLHALAETETSIKQKTDKITVQRQQLQNRNDNLSSRKTQRLQVMAKLDQQILTKQQHLKNLQRERAHLEQVLSALEEAIGDIRVPTDSRPFAKQRGNLHWPVKGKLRHSYGSLRNTEMKWEGWLLSAPEGSGIHSIHHGRVVFSDYLRGHGLLIIVDHGDGYMSLYAHNQVLLKEAGDWVTTGETIARVGNTGGQKEHALYFEIRQNGKPTDPRKWLAKS